MASPAKKAKVQSKTRQYFSKKAHYDNKKKHFLDVGNKGYLVTYIAKEKDCIREVYKLLNDFHKPDVAAEEPPKAQDNNESDEDDITVQINNAIDKTKQEAKEKQTLFQALDLGTPGSTFIRADIPNHYELAMKIINDLAETKVKRTRFTNRIIPIESVCRAKIEDIVDAAGLLFDKHFLKDPSTFGINFNRKFNGDINREEVIKRLAELVHLKNSGNKVNLKTPEKTIIVEVVKGLCMLSVVPDYNKLKKYNLHELAKDDDEKEEDKSVTAETEKKEEAIEESKETAPENA